MLNSSTAKSVGHLAGNRVTRKLGEMFRLKRFSDTGKIGATSDDLLGKKSGSITSIIQHFAINFFL